jgi:hypothetical protein
MEDKLGQSSGVHSLCSHLTILSHPLRVRAKIHSRVCSHTVWFLECLTLSLPILKSHLRTLLHHISLIRRPWSFLKGMLYPLRLILLDLSLPTRVKWIFHSRLHPLRSHPFLLGPFSLQRHWHRRKLKCHISPLWSLPRQVWRAMTRFWTKILIFYCDSLPSIAQRRVLKSESKVSRIRMH